MTSCVQFSARPGVGGIPPIVRAAAINTRWFATTLVDDTVVVNAGVVYEPTPYSPNDGAGYLYPFQAVTVPTDTVTLTTAAAQLVVLRCTYLEGHTGDAGDALYSLFDETLQDSDASTTLGYTVDSKPIGDPPAAVTLYGTVSRAQWLEDATYAITAITAASLDPNTDVVLAEVAYDSGTEVYTLTPRHDGAVFIIHQVRPKGWAYSW